MFREFRRTNRSIIRKSSGKLFFQILRYIHWHFAKQKFATARGGSSLPHVCASHSTPLLRNLANVDMWMQRNKIVNLGIAARKLNGLLLKPGETLSFWKAVGKPTRRKGYLPGMTLQDGRLKPGVGGGLCQLSNLIYWMTLHTPLTVTERHRHSYDVFPDSNRTQPFGSGATCAYNFIDLQVRNDTHIPFQLDVSLVDGCLLGSWRSSEPCSLRYEVFEKDHSIVCAAFGGYIRHNALWRKVADTCGTIVGEEFIAENNALMMYQPYLAPPADEPVPTRASFEITAARS
jgi:vancomycin resistance protein VanW